MTAATNLAGRAPAAMKTLVVTSSQLEDIHAALLVHRMMREHLKLTITGPTFSRMAGPAEPDTIAYLDDQINRVNVLIRLVDKA